MLARRKRISIAPLLYFIQLFAVMLIILSLTRLCFYFYNHNEWLEQNPADIFQAFIHGIRFDLSALMMVNALLLISLLISSVFYQWQGIKYWGIRGIFWLFNLPLLLMNCADIIYFPFSGRRSGIETLDYTRDFSQQAGQIINQYYVGIVIVVLFIGLLVYFIKPRFVKIKVSLWQYTLLVICSISICILSIRGGLQQRPLSVYHSMSWSKPALTALVLNTPFTMIRKKTSDLKAKHWFASKAQAFELVQPDNFQLVSSSSANKSHIKANSKPQNVVVILLESFGLEYVKDLPLRASYTPFLKSLSEKSLYFENGFANGRISIDSVPSVLAGIPSLMSRSFARSPYNLNELYALPRILSRYGYHNSFFHGARNGSMFFDVMAKQFGFDEYHGRTEYNNDDDYDGQWGIFDEPFLQYTANKLNNIQQPFFSTIFTLSSHNPYTLPAKYKDDFKNAEIPMHRVVQYSDMALQKFFATAEKMPWYKNTLFVITADHTSDNHEKAFASKIGKHRIPMILYSPSGLIPAKKSQKIVQQLDVPVTVLDFLGLAEQEITKLSPFGRSMLNTEAPGKALFFENSLYWLLSGGNYTTIDKKGLHSETLPISEEFSNFRVFKEESSTKELKANLQLYSNGLINDDLYYDSRTTLSSHD